MRTPEMEDGKSGKISIMIVDDTPANLELLSGTLKEDGYRIKTAPSGRLALQAALKDPPDLILLDIMMPEMDGYEVLRRLKENPATRGVPVIFITALDKEFDEEKGLSMGAVDYITKPIRLPIVRSRVSTHLQLKLHRDRLEQMVGERTEELEKTNRDLEREISERRKAEERVRRSLEEKEVMLKEIHHRVKNNLQIISSMLSLQEPLLKNVDDLALYVDSRSRIRAMALVHEKLYAAEDFSRVKISEHIHRLIHELKQVYGVSSRRINIRENVDEAFMDVNAAIPCSQVVNELVSNAIKHAFADGREGVIEVGFNIDERDNCTLTVRDNGVGLPSGLAFPEANTIGWGIVRAFVQQLDGTISMRSVDGLEFLIEFTYRRPVINGSAR